MRRQVRFFTLVVYEKTHKHYVIPCALCEGFNELHTPATPASSAPQLLLLEAQQAPIRLNLLLVRVARPRLVGRRVPRHQRDLRKRHLAVVAVGTVGCSLGGDDNILGVMPCWLSCFMCCIDLLVMALIVNDTPLAFGIGSRPGPSPQRHGGCHSTFHITFDGTFDWA